MSSDIFDEINSGKYSLIDKKDLDNLIHENNELKSNNEKLKKIIKFLNRELEYQDEILENANNFNCLSCLDCNFNNIFRKFFD